MSFPLMPFIEGFSSVRSTSVVASSTSAGSTIVIPVAVQSGDLLILVDAPDFSSIPTTFAPTGFTVLATGGFGSLDSSGILASAKIAIASDAGSTITGMNGDQRNGKIIFVVRGDNPIGSFPAAKNAASTISGAAPISQLAVSTGVTSPAIVVGVAAATTTSNVVWNSYGVSNTLPVFDTTNGVSGNPTVCIGISNLAEGSAAFDQRIDMNDQGTNTLLVFWLEVR